MAKLNSAKIKSHGTGRLAIHVLVTVLLLQERYLYTAQMLGICLRVGNESMRRAWGAIMALHAPRLSHLETKRSTRTRQKRGGRWEAMVLKLAYPSLLSTSLCF